MDRFIRYILMMKQGSPDSVPLTNYVLVVGGAMVCGDIRINPTKNKLNN